MERRATAKWTLSLGLLTFPVKAYTMFDDDRGNGLKVISPCCGETVQRPYLCGRCGQKVDISAAPRGVVRGKQVVAVLTPEEVQSLEEGGKGATLEGFVPAASLDITLVQDAYYLAPDEGGERAYSLLYHLLSATRSAIVGRVFRREREHLVAIVARETRLVLLWLRFPSDRREAPPVVLLQPSEKELELARKLVDAYATESDLSRFPNTYAERLKKLVEAKLSGQPIPVPVTVQRPEADIVKAMEAMLAEKKKKTA